LNFSHKNTDNFSTIFVIKIMSDNVYYVKFYNFADKFGFMLLLFLKMCYTYLCL